MSRFYEAEGENPAEYLYWPNLRRAVRGQRGQVAEANREEIAKYVLLLAPVLKKSCGGDKAIASVVATMLANVVYYDD